jgi:hypothetical protein
MEIYRVVDLDMPIPNATVLDFMHDDKNYLHVEVDCQYRAEGANEYDKSKISFQGAIAPLIDIKVYKSSSEFDKEFEEWWTEEDFTVKSKINASEYELYELIIKSIFDNLGE